MTSKLTVAAVAVALTLPVGTRAAESTEIAELRGMIEQLKNDYETRITTLEARLAEAEGKAERAAGEAREAASAAARPVAPAGGTGQNAFNPGVALILSGLYASHSAASDGYRITGFNLPGEALEEFAPERGFSLAESELAVYANIDPYFYGALTLALAPDDTVGVEEAYVQTTALSHGLTLKAGRFFSGIGYLNEQHAHTWDFVDAPLAYQAFFGGQFGDDGVELRWLAPTDTFLELGASVGRGSGFPGTGDDKNGIGAGALFAHVGGDVGDSNSWRAGVSWLTTSPRDREWDDVDAFATPVVNSFDGRSRTWVLDGVWKWAPHGNPHYTNFKLQAEYMRRTERGDMLYDLDGAAQSSRYETTQSGWYLQGIYQFAPSWRIGLRGEQLDSGDVDYGGNNANLLRPDYDPSRYALMLEFAPSEFSRVRLQLARDESRQGVTDDQWFLQYQMSLGAHGAHKY